MYKYRIQNVTYHTKFIYEIKIDMLPYLQATLYFVDEKNRGQELA